MTLLIMLIVPIGVNTLAMEGRGVGWTLAALLIDLAFIAATIAAFHEERHG